jgi:hypothetical protein
LAGVLAMAPAAPGLLADGATTTSAAAPAAVEQAQEDGGARLDLVDQRLAVDPNGTIELRYVLTGLSLDELQLLIPPEPPPTVATDATDATEPTDPATPAPPELPALPALTVEVTNYAPLTDPDDVARVVGSAIDPDVFRGISDAVDGVAFDARPVLVPNDDGTAELTLEIETDVVDSVETRLKLEQPGVYPLRIQLRLGDRDDGNVIATAGTVIQRVGGAVDTGFDAPPPIDLAVVTVAPGPPFDAGESTRDLARSRLDDAIELADTISSPVTLQVAPTMIAEAASTPEAAERLADALENDELVAFPIVPLDVSSAAAAGAADSYIRLLTAGEDLLTDSLPTTASSRDIWITTDPLSAEGAQLLRDLGTRFVVIPEALYTSSIDGDLPPTDRFVEAELPDGGTLPVIVVDPLASELTVAAGDRTLATSTATEWAVETLTELLVEQSSDDDATSSSSAPRRSRVLTTPDLSSPDTRLVGALEGLAATTPAIRFSPASTLIGRTDVALDASDDPAVVELPDDAPSLDDRVELIDLTRLELNSAASMLPDDDPRVAEWATTLDTLISTGYTDDQAQAIATELVAEATAFSDAVVLPEPFTFTLTGRSGTFEIRMGNTLDEPLDVIVALDAQKVTFPDGEQRVTLRPLDETSLFVPVQAESNGTSSIDVVVSTPAGQILDEPVTLTVRVSALTGLGQVLTGGLILVLLTWWYTHWRSRRRAELAVDVRDRHPSARAVESDPS